jgi:superfamily II DNA/RNA helicase
MIVRKAYLTEMDLLRLQKALLMCRMAADSTYLVDKEAPGYSTKLERLAELLPQLAAEKERKVVLFSEWTTMLDLIEKTILKPGGLGFVRLDGRVPQKKRQVLVDRFRNDRSCVFFAATNAGATGLNLQAANTVVNVDLPWNPAVLEQRIGRAHRMGQKRPVQVYVLVTEQTLEESMLTTLSAKHELAQACLDLDSDITKVDLKTGVDNLKKRLEVLLGDRAAAPLDVQEQRRVEEETDRLQRRQRIEEAGGRLVTAAFSLLSEMVPASSAPAPDAVAGIRTALESCLESDGNGGVSLRLRLPDASALGGFASAVASLVAAGTPAGASAPDRR